MNKKEEPKIKITDIVGNIVKADQGSVKSPQTGHKSGSYQLDDDDLVTLNIGGVRHETRISTLLKKPETRLYAVGEAAKASGKKEFYFDRNPQIFPCILNYYRIGKLHMPTDVCGPAAKAELDYWELEDKDIEECCWVNYISYEETMEMLEKFQSDERDKFHPVYVSPEASFFAKTKPRLWRALQDPYSSRAAMAFAVISLFVVLVSITVFVIETLPYFGSVFVHASKTDLNITSDDLRREMDIFTDVTPNDILLIIDNSCNAYFFIEFVIKLLASPNKTKFFKSPLIVIEMLCLIPYYIGILIVMVHPDPIKVFLLVRVLFATRVLRIFRIFVLMKHFLALKILIFTIRASTKELFLLLIVLIIGVIIFACLEYYMEIFSNIESEFETIPLAFWWALITMTTVGYGDVKPTSGLGYCVGGLCAISGVLVIALSVPVIVNNFTVYYTHAQSREKLKLRRKKFEQTEKWQRLKAGLKSKLKNGALNGILNGIKKRNNIIPTAGTPVAKIPFLKLGGGQSSRADSDNEQVMPNTARDVVLEDVSETINGESTTEIETEAETHIGNGTISCVVQEMDSTSNSATDISPRPKTVLNGTTKFFEGAFKKPGFLKSTFNGKSPKGLSKLADSKTYKKWK
ncbi:potassium voltage-gated channel protein Shaw-like [Mya arenaria]|uniref:potassium voltage-gated channel protein Shaw-like n=1 Tax=Mya arenaria TaxID=6604 RepID=UPI0022E7EF79|nr:potassium voltage-gated channel protein Shaw-like [Mya arenaria]